MIGGVVVALDFGGRRAAATAAGLLDAVGYAGASLAGIGVAKVVAAYGWRTAFTALLGLALAALAMTAAVWAGTGTGTAGRARRPA